MWICVRYLVIFISISSYPVVVTNDNDTRRFQQEFKRIDSDFDLQEAMENFNYEDYQNMTQDITTMLDAGPRNKDFINITSAEITNLLKMGEKLMNSPEERKLQNLRNSIIAREENMKLQNSTKTIQNTRIEKKRVKRQSKFMEASKVDNLKMLRIYLMMFKNLYANSYTGGAHPLHTDVPKPIIYLFKRRIMEFFFPPIGADKKTNNA